MDKYDVKRVLDSIETMSNDSEALSKKLRSSWMNSGTILKLAEGDEDDRRRGSELLDALVRHIYEIVIDSYNSQYRIVCSMSRLKRRITKDESMTNNFAEDAKYIDIVSADNTLYVKLPRVPAKCYKRTELFAEDVNDKMWELRVESKIPSIPDKLIRVLNVFSTSFEDRYISDNDNYDLKTITDILTDHIGGGDGGLKCSFFYDAVKSDEVAEGTYIIVSNFKEGIPSADAVIAVLKAIFEDENE